MKNKSELSMAIFALISGTLISGAVFASAVTIKDSMTRSDPGSVSGDGVSTVEANCAIDPSGNDWQGATATLLARQVGNGSTVDIQVRNAVPNEVFTIWLRLKGDVDGVPINPDGSPLTGGGSTPLAPGTDLPTLIANSSDVNPDGTPNPVNGFTTNQNGAGFFSIDLDFALIGGAYPFNEVGSLPTAIVDPTAVNVNASFLLRMVSHCTDHAGHGLSPGTREAWFQYP